MTRVGEIMTSVVKVVPPETTLRELAEFLVEEDVTGAPVVSGRRVVGVVSATDLLEFDYEGEARPGAAAGNGDEWSSADEEMPAAYFLDLWDRTAPAFRHRLETAARDTTSLDTHSTGEVMTRDIISVSPDADIREAAARMLETGVHRVLVMDGDELAGIVTTTDIVRAVAERGLG